MSATIATAKRRRALSARHQHRCAEWLASASAQTPPTALPPVEVSPPTDQNKTRARPLDNEGSGTAPRPARTARPARGAGTGASDGASPGIGDASGTSSGVRQFNGIVGASSTVITAEQIAHSPSQTLPRSSRRRRACN